MGQRLSSSEPEAVVIDAAVDVVISKNLDAPATTSARQAAILKRTGIAYGADFEIHVVPDAEDVKNSLEKLNASAVPSDMADFVDWVNADLTGVIHNINTCIEDVKASDPELWTTKYKAAMLEFEHLSSTTVP